MTILKPSRLKLSLLEATRAKGSKVGPYFATDILHCISLKQASYACSEVESTVVTVAVIQWLVFVESLL